MFYSTLGHPRELWDTPWMQKMYFEALKWAMAALAAEPDASGDRRVAPVVSQTARIADRP